MWQDMIPFDETPYQYNPDRGFVSSANQDPADSSYPYYLGRGYSIYRGLIINRKLQSMNHISPRDMMGLQTNNDNEFASIALPLLLDNINEDELTPLEKRYVDTLRAWNFSNAPGAVAPTIFNILWEEFSHIVLDDEFKNAPKPVLFPYESSIVQGIMKDSAYHFLDNKNTPEKETLADDVTAAIKVCSRQIEPLAKANRLQWAAYKATGIRHLSRFPALSRLNLPIGGGTNCINAAKPDHGPSWRMIVSLTPQTEAFGIYPGGQSGNPGSRYYDTFVDKWAIGQYYSLWMMSKGQEKDDRVKWKMSFVNKPV